MEEKVGCCSISDFITRVNKIKNRTIDIIPYSSEEFIARYLKILEYDAPSLYMDIIKREIKVAERNCVKNITEELTLEQVKCKIIELEKQNVCIRILSLMENYKKRDALFLHRMVREIMEAKKLGVTKITKDLSLDQLISQILKYKMKCSCIF